MLHCKRIEIKEEVYLSIGKNLKLIRKQKKQSQTLFAKSLGISRTYLSDLENDRKSPSIETVTKIAEKLNISTLYLLEGKKTFEDLSIEDQTRLRKEHLENLTTINEDELLSLFYYLDNLEDNRFNNETVSLMYKALKYSETNKVSDNDDPVYTRKMSYIIDTITSFSLGQLEAPDSDRKLGQEDVESVLSNLIEVIKTLLQK